MTVTMAPRTAMCRAAIAALPCVAAGDGAAFLLGLHGGRRARLRLGVADGWADLTVELGGSAGRTNPWDALALNAVAGGAARLILRPGDAAVALRADVPFAADGDPAPRLASACEDLRRFAIALETGAVGPIADAGESSTPDARPVSSPNHDGGVDIAALLTEAGWPFVQRASNRIAVDLGLPDQFQQAFITPGAGERHRVRATLAVVGTPAAATRNALGVLLLTVSAVVRTARGGRINQDGESTLFFESPLDDAPAASDVDVALCAVAMACQMAGLEARALIDERIAEAYLAARGWAA